MRNRSGLETLLVEARSNRPGMEERVCLAHEGMTIDLDEAGVTFAD